MAVHNLIRVEDHVKNFRPQLLVLSGMTSARPSLIDFAQLITKNLSLLVCGNIIKVCMICVYIYINNPNKLFLFILIHFRLQLHKNYLKYIQSVP